MNEQHLRVGWIGMGIMGAPMAMNCLKAGFDVTVYNRTAGKTDPLREAGAKVAGSPAEAAAAADVVLSCVSDTPDVLEVVLDERRGVLAGAREGLIVIDHSTVSPPVARRCSAALSAKGAGFLDAPVSGGQGGAQQAALSIMVGGEKAHFDRALPVLKAMGKTITHCGPSGAGYTVKLCNQTLCGLHLLAACEALSLADAAGVDLTTMLRAVSSGASASWVLDNLAPKMVRSDYAPGFFVDYLIKDLRIARETAGSLGVPMVGSAVAENLLLAAAAQGLGREGTQSLYEVTKNMRGSSGP